MLIKLAVVEKVDGKFWGFPIGFGTYGKKMGKYPEVTMKAVSDCL